MISATFRHGKHSRPGPGASSEAPIRHRRVAGLPIYPAPTRIVRGLSGYHANGNSLGSKLDRDG